MWVGCPGGYGCCSPEWGKSPVETCGLAACWEGWVPTGDLSGTRTGAVGLTGHSEGRNRAIKKRDHKWITIAAFYKLDPPEDAAHEIESFREPEGQTEPIPPPQITPKLVVCFSVHLNLIKSFQVYHNKSIIISEALCLSILMRRRLWKSQPLIWDTVNVSWYIWGNPLGASHLSRAWCSMLGWGLVACWGTRGLGLMHCTRVVGEGLLSYREK